MRWYVFRRNRVQDFELLGVHMCEISPVLQSVTFFNLGLIHLPDYVIR